MMSKTNNDDLLPSLEGVDKESLAKSLAIAMQIKQLQSAAQKFFELSNASHPSHSGLPIADPREQTKATLVSVAIMFVQSNVNTKLGLDQTRDMLEKEAQGGNKNNNPWEKKLSLKQSNVISAIMHEIQKDPAISEKLSHAEKAGKKI
jgi:hypothetical protein